MEIQNGSELRHDGLKGMKWGIRRWRNPDGSLTEEGKEKYNYYTPKTARGMERRYYQQFDSRNGDSPLTKQVQGYKDTVGAVETVLDRAKFGIREKSLAGKSNKELQDAIERGRLESQYRQYYPTTYKTKQREKLDKILGVVGGVAAAGVTAAKLFSMFQTRQLVANEAYDAAQANRVVDNLLANTKNITLSDLEKLSPDQLKTVSERVKTVAGTMVNVNNLRK